MEFNEILTVFILFLPPYLLDNKWPAYRLCYLIPSAYILKGWGKSQAPNMTKIVGNNMKSVALHNLGCKVNAYELEVIGQKLQEKGYDIVSFDKKRIYIS